MDRRSMLILAKGLVADKRLSATAKLLFAQLSDHRNKKTGQCNPKRQTLAEELGVSVPTVSRALGELRAAKLIRSAKRPRTNSYEVLSDQNDPAEVISVGSNPCGVSDQNDPALYLTEPIQDELKAAASSGFEGDLAAAAPKATRKPAQKPPARETDDGGFRLVRDTLNEMAPLAGLPLPDDDLVRRVIEAANGAGGQEIQDALVLMWKRGALRNMRSWGFIPIKIQDLARKAATA